MVHASLRKTINSEPVSGDDYFSLILRDYLATHHVSRGTVGAAPSERLPARGLVAFAAQWMTAHFAGA